MNVIKRVCEGIIPEIWVQYQKTLKVHFDYVYGIMMDILNIWFEDLNEAQFYSFRTIHRSCDWLAHFMRARARARAHTHTHTHTHTQKCLLSYPRHWFRVMLRVEIRDIYLRCWELYNILKFQTIPPKSNFHKNVAEFFLTNQCFRKKKVI